jgi:Ca2+-binding RTX toxin-like protein
MSDRMLGGDGYDIVHGDVGNDTLRGVSTFTKLTGNAGTTLSADQFVIGPHALDANDRIIYSNGALIYDHNGNVAGGEQLIAILSGRPTLSNTDILLG